MKARDTVFCQFCGNEYDRAVHWQHGKDEIGCFQCNPREGYEHFGSSISAWTAQVIREAYDEQHKQNHGAQ